MGSIFSTFRDTKNIPSERIWPIRYFNQVITPDDMRASRFSKWDPKMYAATLKYPAKEPPKDF